MPQFKNSAGGIVLSKDGCIILVQQRDGSWSFPKGKIEHGEEVEHAARREIYEEAGLQTLRCIKFLGSYTRFSLTDAGKESMERMKHLSLFLYSAEHVDLMPVDANIVQATWVPISDVVSHLSNPRDQEFFETHTEALLQVASQLKVMPIAHDFSLQLVQEDDIVVP